MKVVIEAYITPDVWRFTGTVKLRIYARQSFWTSDGQFIPQGTPGQANTAYLEVVGEVTANSLTLPSFEIDSTVDSSDNPWATYDAELVANSKRIPFLNSFSVNTLEDGDPSYTWAEIIQHKNLIQPQSIPESLGRQISALVTSAVGSLNKSSETNAGSTALTADPADPTFPIAVGANDTRWTALTEQLEAAETPFDDGDTSPSVATGDHFRTTNTASTSISTFDDGEEGQIVTVRVLDTNTTFVHGLGISTRTGADMTGLAASRTSPAGLVYRFILRGGVWYQLSQSVNVQEEPIVADGTLAGATLVINAMRSLLVDAGVFIHAFVPADAPGLIAHWDADGLAAGALAAWPDLSGNGHSMGGGVAPTVVAGALNGKSVVRFAVGQFLTFAEIANIRTAYLLVKHDQSTSVNRDRFMPLLGHDVVFDWAGNEGTRLLSPAANAAVVNGTGYLNGEPVEVTKVGKAGTYELYAIVTTSNTKANQIANDRNAHFFVGDIAAIVLFDQAHTAQTQAQMWAYFRQQRALGLPKLVAIDGDSLSADRPTSGNGLFAGNAWPDQMIPPLSSGAFGIYDTYDLAVGGQGLAAMIADAVTEVDPFFNPNRTANVLVVWGGTNQMGPNLFSNGTDAYNMLVSYCQARQAAGFTVVVLTVTPRQDLANFGGNAALLAQFEVDRTTFNNNIRNNWGTFADAMLDLDTVDLFNNGTGAAGADGTPDLTNPNNTLFYNADKIHLTALGQTVVAQAVQAVIETL